MGSTTPRLRLFQWPLHPLARSAISRRPFCLAPKRWMPPPRRRSRTGRPGAESIVATRWLTFDCFGTLVDWRHGIGTTGELLFPGRGADLLGAYIEIEAEVEKEKPFRRYRVGLAETLRRAAASLKLDLKHDDA